MGGKKDFFISHSSKDTHWAKWVATELQKAGYTVELDVWHWSPGQNFVHKMQQALENCERVMPLFSTNYFFSQFGLVEFYAAFSEDPLGENLKVVPIKIEEIVLTGLFKTILHINFLTDDKKGTVDEEEAVKRLLAGVKATPPVKPVMYPGVRSLRYPGSLPEIWIMPDQNKNFSGRVNLLKDLNARLSNGSTAVTANGLGGVGKSQLAIEFAYINSFRYDFAGWIRSENNDELMNDYTELAKKAFNVTDDEMQNKPAVAEAFRNYLNTCPHRWLIIFDNATEPEAIQSYLPQSKNHHVIITSRWSKWSRHCGQLDVDVWKPEESLEFLEKTLGGAGRGFYGELAKRLGDLPLALEQAAAFLEDNEADIEGYLNELTNRGLKVLEEGKPLDKYYKETIRTTWKISFTKVSKEDKAAEQLLNLIAYMQPDAIPLEIFSHGGKHLPDPLKSKTQNNTQFSKTAGLLIKYSLVKKNVSLNTLSIHRMVQEVIQEMLADVKDEKQWIEAGIKAVNECFPFDLDNTHEWPKGNRLSPCGLELCGHAEKSELWLEEAGRLLNQVGAYNKVRAQFDDALSILKRALAVLEKTYGSDHPNIATCLSNVGGVLSVKGDYDGALMNNRRALAIDEKYYGPDDPNVARDLNNIGLVLKDKGEHNEALKYYRRALEIFGKAYNPDHPKVAISLNNIGQALHEKRDYDGALINFHHALAINEKTLGSDHPGIAININNIGAVLHDLGDYDGALNKYNHALEIDEKTYGPDHPDVAIDLNNIGMVLDAKGDYDGALKNFNRALEIDKKTYGPDHPDVAIDLNNIGGALHAKGDYDGALNKYNHALEIDEKTYGPDHPNVAIRLSNIGLVLKDKGDYDGARVNYERAYGIMRKVFGENHPSTITVKRNLDLLARLR